MSSEATPLPPTIPDYELLRLIGRGAYGEVWLARGVTGVFRAVKVVWRDRFPEAGPYEREFHGLRQFAAVSLSEPRQLALLHVGRDPAAAHFYYVMELADDATKGREIDPADYTPHTLREARARRGRLPAAECLALGVELARALAGLHARGLVHRDIKPSNVIFVGGAPKLADIGLVTAASAALTFVGTEGFVPPEGPGAPGADVFALGKLLYELLTGLDRHDYPRLPPDLHTWPDRAAALELNEVLIRACDPHPDRRHADATALLDDLLLLQAGRSVRRLRKAERRLARALRAAAALALVAAIAGLGAYLERQRADRAEAERDALLQRKIYANTLGNVRQHIDREEFGQARRLLREAVPAPGQADLRAFEWHALWREAQGDPATVLRDEGPGIDKLAVAPDGQRLAVHDMTDTVVLHELPAGRETGRLRGVRFLGGFSSDAQWLVGSVPDDALQRWRVADGSPGGPAHPVANLRMLGPQGPDRVVVLTGRAPMELLVWDFARRVEILRLPLAEPGVDPPWEFFRAGLDPAGRQLAIAWIRGRSSEAEFRVTAVDLRGPDPVAVHATLPQRPGAVGTDEHGAWAALDDTGQVWRAGPAGWRRTEEVWPPGVRKRLPLPGGGHLIADRDRLHWLDPQGRTVRPGRGHAGGIGDLVALPGTGRVFSASLAGELRAWPAGAGERTGDARAVWNSRGGPTRVVFSPDGRQVAVPLDGSTSVILDLATLETIRPLPGLRLPLHWQADTIVGVAADGGGLLACSATTGGAGPRSVAAATHVLQGLVSADGRLHGATDREGRLWLESAGAVTTLPGDYQNWFMLLPGGDGRRLWSAGNRNRLRCQSLPDGAELWSATLPALAPFLCLLPGERQLLVPLENARLEVRDAATGALLQSVATGGSTPQAIVASHDGRRVFIAGSRGDIVCLDTTDWSSVGVFRVPGAPPLHFIGVAPDDGTLAVVTKTGGLHLVRARP